MRAVVEVLLLIGVELLAASLLARAAGRRPRSAHAAPGVHPDAGTSLARGAPWAAALVLAAVGLRLLFGDGLPADATTRRMTLMGAFALPGIAAAAGGWLLLYAGRREHCGDLARARSLARAGGRAAALGASGSIAAVAAAWLLGGLEAGAWLLAVLAGLTGFGTGGLLAGLSGKPRPAGVIAVCCYLLAAYGWVIVCG